jgi:hypothetical protein
MPRSSPPSDRAASQYIRTLPEPAEKIALAPTGILFAGYAPRVKTTLFTGVAISL